MTTPDDPAARLYAAATVPQAGVLQQATVIARDAGIPLYLVGGAVRDLLMGTPLHDLDLTIEGEPRPFAHRLATAAGGTVTMQSQFDTCNLEVSNMTVDIARARSETYAYAGALPAIRPAGILEDLFRRDFTINALAMRLNPYPVELLDPTHGKRDIAHRSIRFLHAKSFRDDATRTLRAVRYEQRLGFHLERTTENALVRDLHYLATISADRLRRELGLVFEESQAPSILRRAAGLGILAAIHPSLPEAGDLASRLERVPEEAIRSPLTYLALLTFDTTREQRLSFASRLRLPRRWGKVVEDTALAEQSAAEISPDMPPSEVYDRLRGLGDEAVEVAGRLAHKPAIHAVFERYLREWRHVRPLLDGDDVIRLGVPRGPGVRRVLEALRSARLDGSVHTVEDEVRFVKGHV